MQSLAFLIASNIVSLAALWFPLRLGNRCRHSYSLSKGSREIVETQLVVDRWGSVVAVLQSHRVFLENLHTKIIIFHAVFTHYISFMLLKKETHINSGISMYKRECWGGISCLAVAFVMVKGSRSLKPVEFAGLDFDARARRQGFFWPGMSH